MTLKELSGPPPIQYEHHRELGMASRRVLALVAESGSVLEVEIT